MGISWSYSVALQVLAGDKNPASPVACTPLNHPPAQGLTGGVCSWNRRNDTGIAISVSALSEPFREGSSGGWSPVAWTTWRSRGGVGGLLGQLAHEPMWQNSARVYFCQDFLLFVIIIILQLSGGIPPIFSEFCKYTVHCISFIYFYFSSVQSLNPVWFFVTPWTAAHQASLSITNSRSLLKLMSIESVMRSNHLILCRPLLLLPLFSHYLFLFIWRPWVLVAAPSSWRHAGSLVSACRIQFPD